jgi:hypothetical protein
VQIAHLLVAVRVHGAHPLRVHRVLAVGLRRDALELADLQQGGRHGDPALGGRCHVLGGHAGAVLDAVPPGGQQPVDGLGGEGVHGDPGRLGVRDGDRLLEHLLRPQGAQVAAPS